MLTLSLTNLPLQVVTSVLAFYTRGKPPLTFSCPGKTPADYWGKSSGETELLFHQGELLHGCMDKAQYGKFGLVHAVQVQSSLTPVHRLDVMMRSAGLHCKDVVLA